MGLTVGRWALAVVIVSAVVSVAKAASVPLPSERFREAADALRAGDYPKGAAIYRELAASGAESASLYWNWAQAAGARGSRGEALWALLRGLEVEPGDRALGREEERFRESVNLDAAEIAPEPLFSLGRLGRRFHLDLLAMALLAASLVFHAGSRVHGGRRWSPAAWSAFVLGLCLSAVPAVASFARPTGVVLRRDAPLLDSASPTAEAVGALREGEVVPLLGESGTYVRVEDSSGARGWASVEDVRRLDRPPAPSPDR